MDRRSATLFLGTCLGLVASSTHALPVIYNDSIPDGIAAFTNAITSVGGMTYADTLNGIANGNMWVRADYSIASTNGQFRGIDQGYPGLSGPSIGINPQAPANGSGLTFTFNNPVNAFGLEVGDWATCCFPSALYISFDGGAVRQVAVANAPNDNPGLPKTGNFANFVGAVDDKATFSTITFYGDGFGEYLVAGGTVRYGTVPLGSFTGPQDMGLQLSTHNGIGVTRLNMGNLFHRLDGRIHGGLEGQFDDVFPSYNQTADTLLALANAIGYGEDNVEQFLAQMSNWNLQQWQQRQMTMNPSLYSDLALQVDEQKPNPFADLFRVGSWRGNLVVRHHAGDHEAVGAQDAYDFSGYSATLGLDTNIGEKGLFGVALGYGREKSNTLAAATRADNVTKVWSLMAYGSYELKDTTYINAVIGLGHSDHSIERRSGANILVGRPEGEEFMLAVRGGHMFKSKDWAVGPFGGVQYARSKVDAYAETGVGAQFVDTQKVDSLIAELGFQGTTRLMTKGKYEWVPQIRVSLEKEFRDTGRSVNVGPLGGALTPIPVQSRDEDMYVRADLGLAVNFPDPRSSLRLDYEKILRHRSLDEHALTLRFRWLFN